MKYQTTDDRYGLIFASVTFGPDGRVTLAWEKTGKTITFAGPGEFALYCLRVNLIPV